MNQLFIYKLKPRGAFHLGEAGIGVESTEVMIHSDTLFSAIVSAWRHIDGLDADSKISLLTPFVCSDGDMPLYLSSAFPYIENILLLPRPRIKLGEDKSTKKIDFISVEALQEIVQKEFDKKETVKNGKVMITETEREMINSDWVCKSGRKSRTPRVAIDRITSQSEIYFCGRVTFEENCGLYFWADIRNREYKAHLDRALDFLSDEGIGGERSIGHGQFTFNCNENELPTFNSPNASSTRYLTLSLYHPTKDEVCSNKVLDGASYEFFDRGGWIYSPDSKSRRRRRVKMFKEGGLFSRPVAGDIVSVEPAGFPHPVYRYGLAFPRGGLKMEV
ncbi:MAG: type III-A CRISPR-associated RAMP protein Csm4 [Candidatus Hodarchaeales archaeon]